MTFEEGTAAYYREHPEEIDIFIETAFEEYAVDGDLGALLSGLRIIARAKGISSTAKAAGLTRNGLQKVLSEEGNPYFSNFHTILQTIGYQLTPKKVSSHQ